MSVKYEPYNWRQHLPTTVIGIDEAGRGCLAGRVYAAAVILNSDQDISLYTDSKALSEHRREELFKSIQTHHRWSIGFAEVEEIEKLNIFHASYLAMKRAVEGLGVQSGVVLVDGNKKIANLAPSFEQICLVKGDLRATPISAASIVAKVSRDRYITEFGQRFPEYGFSQHKGYATATHRAAIQKYGPLPIHRASFGGVREYLALQK